MLKQRQIAVVLGVIFCLVVICTGTEEETDSWINAMIFIAAISCVVLPSLAPSIFYSLQAVERNEYRRRPQFINLAECLVVTTLIPNPATDGILVVISGRVGHGSLGGGISQAS